MVLHSSGPTISEFSIYNGADTCYIPYHVIFYVIFYIYHVIFYIYHVIFRGKHIIVEHTYSSQFHGERPANKKYDTDYE